jgi:hypothetical protein
MRELSARYLTPKIRRPRTAARFGRCWRRSCNLRCWASAEYSLQTARLRASTAARLRFAFWTSPLVHGSPMKLSFQEAFRKGWLTQHRLKSTRTRLTGNHQPARGGDCSDYGDQSSMIGIFKNGSARQTIDARGKTVVPGICDTCALKGSHQCGTG